ncbi:unnamed protein product [Diamesa serratosioi]
MILLFNEFLIYFLQRLRWESAECQTDDCTRILFVADPQILGEEYDERKFISRLANYDNDKHMERTYKQAVSHTHPHVIIFLGDLLDEGSIANDEKFQRYLKRFKETFPKPANTEIIYIPGDNDIGGEGTDNVKPSKVKRFKQFFDNKDKWKIKNKLNIYHINRITHEMPLLVDNEEQETEENSGIFRIFISHFSILLVPGTFSYKSIERFKPHVMFSGHNHRSSQITSEIVRLRFSNSLSLQNPMTYDLRSIESNQEVLELQVPSCSYRMGEAKFIGYGYGVFENGFLFYSVLWIPNRFTQFKFYFVFLVALVLLNIVLSKIFRRLFRSFRMYQNLLPI